MNVRKPISVFCVIMFLGGCGGTGCEEQIIDKSSSPNGGKEAVSFERNCGATTDFVRGVSIIDSALTHKENMFDDAVFLIEGQPKISMRWIDENKVTVYSSGTGSPAIREIKELNGVKIDYE